MKRITLCVNAQRLRWSAPPGDGLPSRLGGLPQAMIVALLLSLVSVTVVALSGEADPFIFNSLQLAAQLPTMFFASALLARRAGMHAPEIVGTLRLLWIEQRLSCVRIGALLSVTAVNYGMFVWSTRLIEPALSVMLYETWPIAMALVVARRSGPAARRLGRSAAVPLCLVVVGTGLVIVSQAEGALHDTTVSWGIGVGLGIAAGVMGGAFPAATLLFGWAALSHAMRPQQAPQVQVVFWSCLAHAVGAGVGVAVGIVIALLSAPDTMTVTSKAFGGAMLMGCVLVGGAGVSMRIAHVKSRNLGINAVYGLAPPLALLWLTAMGFTLSRLWLFSIGAALVIAANAYVGRESLKHDRD